jgi:hypothetical protein
LFSLTIDHSAHRIKIHIILEQSKVGGFYSSMQKDNNKFAWLINGDQYFGAYHPFESFEGNHPKRFKDFLQYLKQLYSKRFIFLSGDRHLFEEMTIPKDVIGYKTWELTTSGMHAVLIFNPQKYYENKYRTEFVTGKYNYLNINSKIEKDLLIDYQVRSRDDETPVDKTLRLPNL